MSDSWSTHGRCEKHGLQRPDGCLECMEELRARAEQAEVRAMEALHGEQMANMTRIHAEQRAEQAERERDEARVALRIQNDLALERLERAVAWRDLHDALRSRVLALAEEWERTWEDGPGMYRIDNVTAARALREAVKGK